MEIETNANKLSYIFLDDGQMDGCKSFFNDCLQQSKLPLQLKLLDHDSNRSQVRWSYVTLVDLLHYSWTTLERNTFLLGGRC
jgi:hypothetical protein